MAKACRVPLVTFLILGALLVSSSAAGAASPSSASAAGSVRKIALGVSMQADRSIAAVDAFTSQVGRAPALWSMWSNWGGPDRAFPNATFMGQLRHRGIVPVIVWQPANPADPQGGAFRYSLIIKGKFDAYIRTWAKAAKAFGGRVILRFAHEMNGYWFPWGITRFNNTPARFIKAWRHIWTIIHTKVGAKNVKYLWSPGSPCPRCTPYSRIYPGNKYVDYVGFTAFNWGLSRGWKSMVQKFTPAMKQLAKVTRKPVIAAETGTTDESGKKAAWIGNGYPTVYKTFHNLTAIIYFNLDMRFVQQPDWSLAHPPAALAAYRAIAALPRFHGRIT
jgi:mannan endo-1,4-beta-mannosidase